MTGPLPKPRAIGLTLPCLAATVPPGATHSLEALQELF